MYRCSNRCELIWWRETTVCVVLFVCSLYSILMLDIWASCSKTLQKSRHVAMGRKKFNMDPKKVNGKSTNHANAHLRPSILAY